jgi:hypothetical protein
MKSTNHSHNKNKTINRISNPKPWTQESLAAIRTTARDCVNPVDYQHPYPHHGTVLLTTCRLAITPIEPGTLITANRLIPNTSADW